MRFTSRSSAQKALALDSVGLKQLENTMRLFWPLGETLGTTKSNGRRQHPRSDTHFVCTAFIAVIIPRRLRLALACPANLALNYTLKQYKDASK